MISSYMWFATSVTKSLWEVVLAEEQPARMVSSRIDKRKKSGIFLLVIFITLQCIPIIPCLLFPITHKRPVAVNRSAMAGERKEIYRKCSCFINPFFYMVVDLFSTGVSQSDDSIIGFSSTHGARPLGLCLPIFEQSGSDFGSKVLPELLEKTVIFLNFFQNQSTRSILPNLPDLRNGVSSPFRHPPLLHCIDRT